MWVMRDGDEANDSKEQRIILMDALGYSFQLSMHAFVLEDCSVMLFY